MQPLSTSQQHSIPFLITSSYCTVLTTKLVHRVSEQIINNITTSAQHFVYHQPQDTHLSSTTIVQLDGTLLQLILLAEAVPGLAAAVAEISGGISSSVDVLHDEDLQETNEGHDLKDALLLFYIIFIIEKK